MSYIVVVEDEHTAALEIQMSLEEAGHSVPKVFSSGEGLISAFERGDWMQAPELLLIDLTPAGMLNGVETARRLKEFTNIPIIFLTSEYDQVLRSAAERVKPQGYVSKPIQRDILCNTVQDVLAQEQGEAWQLASLSTLGDGMIITDTQARITFVNPVAERLLGVRNALARGRLLQEVYTLRTYEQGRPHRVGRTVQLPLQQVLGQGQMVATNDHLLVDVNGYELRIMERMIPLRNANNEIIGMHIAFSVMNRASNKSGMNGKIEDFEDTVAIMHSFTTMASQGKIVFEQDDALYSFYLEHGRVVHFEHAHAEQSEALYRVASLERGRFSFQPDVPSPKRTMNVNPMHLLLEVSQQQDEIESRNYVMVRRTHKALLMLSNMQHALHYMQSVPLNELQLWLETIIPDVNLDNSEHMLIIEDKHHRLVVPNGDVTVLPPKIQAKVLSSRPQA